MRKTTTPRLLFDIYFWLSLCVAIALNTPWWLLVPVAWVGGIWQGVWHGVDQQRKQEK